MARQLLSIVLLVVSINAVADSSTGELPVRFSSGDRQVALVELFTSEGCSSCPPADRWLSRLKDDSDLWTSVVPMAFHVDYWDYIGWRDRFARPEFSDRQRRYANDGGAGTVYTPGMFKDGHEWRGWIWGRSSNSGGTDVGDLAIQLADDEISARFDAVDSEYQLLILHVALLGMNLESRVRAGENEGKTLIHDFVVLNHASTVLEKNGNSFLGRLRLQEPQIAAQGTAMAAWVSSADRQAPIQATGGFIAD